MGHLISEPKFKIPTSPPPLLISDKSLSRLKRNKKRFQPATGFNISTATLRAFELESIDGFERYCTTSKSYAVLKVHYFEAIVT